MQKRKPAWMDSKLSGFLLAGGCGSGWPKKKGLVDAVKYLSILALKDFRIMIFRKESCPPHAARHYGSQLLISHDLIAYIMPPTATAHDIFTYKYEIGKYKRIEEYKGLKELLNTSQWFDVCHLRRHQSQSQRPQL